MPKNSWIKLTPRNKILIEYAVTQKQSWLAKRLLIPAGILPPAVKYHDLSTNEELRQRIENIGFEYFYMLEQDSSKVNSSSIGGKIFAMHAPWPHFGHQSLKNPLFKKIADAAIFGIRNERQITRDFIPMAEQSFKFAKEIGAKVVTFHIYFFNHKHLGEELDTLAKMWKEYQITPAIEHDGPYIPEFAQSHYYQKFNDSYDWMVDPNLMIKAIDKIYPAKKFGICLDTASIIGKELPMIKTVTPVLDRIVHVHLAGSEKGKDLASEIDRPDIVNVVSLLHKHDYKGYITAEINGTIGENEERIARLYGASSLLGLSLFKNKAIANAQRHIQRSCQYLLENFK